MFDDVIIQSARAHALEEYPNESCGLVVGDDYLQANNIASDKESSFRISREFLAQHRGDIRAVIHSHPDGPYYPSAADMRGQIDSGVPWGIVHCTKDAARPPFFWGDSLPIKPLKGRPFHHGITDCYSLIRDYFRQEMRIALDDFPRDWEWWLQPGFDLYQQNFAGQGFEIISASEVQPGDCFLAQIRSPVINHAGVYTGKGLILHQIGNSAGYSEAHPSCEQPVHIWQRYIRHWVRYTGK